MKKKEYQKFLVDQYNRNRSAEKQVKDMGELNRALLSAEIKHVGRDVALSEIEKQKAIEMLKEQNLIYTIALDRIWDHLSDDEKNRLDWVYDQMEADLNKLQNENTGRVLKRLFDQWGDDNSKSE